MLAFNDQPIKSPREDKFGFKALAKAIADSISKMKSPEGTVIAINGLWGSGKSSLINLVRHHLDNSPKKDDLKIVDSKCWWFSGEEALTIEFFRALYSAMESSKKVTKKAISKLGAQLLIKASQPVGAMTNLFIPSAGSAASKSMKFIAGLIEQDETVEKLHKELSDTLNQDSKHYLVVIDDIDRLSPDEAILIFQLVKSVGRLPNVMYLLAYDRQLAERIVKRRYPSEGPHYLEKIVQASFDLPTPSRAVLEYEFLTRLDSVIEEREFGDDVYFRNLFAEMIAPEIKTPRDLLRILNPLKVTWPAVKGEVDAAEFLCLETLRVRRPKLYATLRANKIRLTGSVEDIGLSDIKSFEEEQSSERYNEIFLETEPPSEHERLQHGLMRLFPSLKRVWTNIAHTNLPADRDVQRRVCSSRHFDTYFRFSLSEYQISRDEIERLIQKASDFDYIQRSFLDAAEIKLPDGFTKATLLIQELAIHTDQIPENFIGDLLKAIYSIADRLIEREGSYIFEGTMPQLDRITRKLIIDRLPLQARPEVLRKACEQAALGYLARNATSAYVNHFPTENNQPKPPEECLTTKEHAVELKELAVKRIREAAANDSLLDVPYLGEMLPWWDILENDEERVRSWASGVLENDLAVARLAKAFTGVSWSSELGDAVSRQSSTAQTVSLGCFIDLTAFRERAEQVEREGKLDTDELEALQIFLEAWRKQENRHNNAEDK